MIYLNGNLDVIMSFRNLERTLIRLFSTPLKEQIEIQIDHKEKFLILSVPIYRGDGGGSPSIHAYVARRQGLTFLPHQTSFEWVEPNQVILVQKVAFDAETAMTTRKQYIAFWQMAKRCHEMLVEMRVEEMISELQIVS
jgi:hypothetical protein